MQYKLQPSIQPPIEEIIQIPFIKRSKHWKARRLRAIARYKKRRK